MFFSQVTQSLISHQKLSFQVLNDVILFYNQFLILRNLSLKFNNCIF